MTESTDRAELIAKLNALRGDFLGDGHTVITRQEILNVLIKRKPAPKFDGTPEDLLLRIAQWDHLNTASDGPFWKAQIAECLAQCRQQPTNENDSANGNLNAARHVAYAEGYADGKSAAQCGREGR